MFAKIRPTMAHILIVDDEPQIRTFVATGLQLAGHTIADAANGREAVQKLLAETFDLVITDIAMPEREGLETVVNIRRQRIQTPVIVMSGIPSESALYLRAAEQLGASRSITKPFTVPQLLEIVNDVLSQPRPVTEISTRLSRDGNGPMRS